MVAAFLYSVAHRVVLSGELIVFSIEHALKSCPDLTRVGLLLFRGFDEVWKDARGRGKDVVVGLEGGIHFEGLTPFLDNHDLALTRDGHAFQGADEYLRSRLYRTVFDHGVRSLERESPAKVGLGATEEDSAG
jgi:hypothetical protein